MTATLSKTSVDFREAKGTRRCGSCAMFHPRGHTCDLVKGRIDSDDVCDRWVKK